MTDPGRALRVAVDAIPLLGPRTGVGAFTGALLAGLARHPGVEPRAYAVTWRRRQRLPAAVPAGVAVAGRPMPARPLWATWSRLPVPPLELFVGGADVVHATNYMAPPTRRAAVVVSVHDLTFVRFPELCQPAALAFDGLVRRALRRGGWVHTGSEFVAGEIADHFGLAPERIRVVPYGIDRPAAAGDPAVGRRLAGGERFVLALGTLEPRKDLPALVAAFDRLAGADAGLRLVLAGPAGWGAAEVDAAIGAARHGGRVVRTGWVNDEQRAGLLAAAAVLAFPSRYEGFGLPVLEAMDAGVPVVATAVGAVREVAGDAAVLVEPGDAAALAGALADVLGDEDRAERLRRAGRERAAAFSWDRMVDGLVGLYRDVASR